MFIKKYYLKTKIKDFDICNKVHSTIGKRVGLNNIAFNTFNMSKTIDGADAPQLWRDGKKLEVISYCRNDVKMTNDIFLKIFHKEELKYEYRDKVKKMKIDFEY